MLQSLIEKHFPAPDRQKLYSLLGIDLSAKKTPSPSDAAAQQEQKGKKRKGNTKFHEIRDGSVFKHAMSLFSNRIMHCSNLFNVYNSFFLLYSLINSSGLEIKKQQKKKPRKHGGLSGTSSEDSQSEESDKESGKDSDDSFKSASSGDEDDDFNPFRDESDDDDEDGETSEGGYEAFYIPLSAYSKPLCLPLP